MVARKKPSARKVVKKAAAKRVSTTKNKRGDNIPTRRAAATRRDPTFTTDVRAAAVDVLPPDGHSTSARSMRYALIQGEIRRDVEPGKWVEVARYAGRGGATHVKRALERGARPVDGDAADWEYQTRRTDDGGSVLYCRLVVNDA